MTRVDEFKLVDSTPGHVLVEVTIHSGKNRIVRRLFDAEIAARRGRGVTMVYINRKYHEFDDLNRNF